jgi:hypothetical protein
MLKSRLLGAVGIVVVVSGVLMAQAPASPPFEVASVKRHQPGDLVQGGGGFQPGGRLALTNFTAGVAQVQRRSLESHIAEIIGPVTVDCWVPGTATVSWDPLQAGFACAQEAVKQHKAFQQVEHGISEDSATAAGLIGKADGRTFVIRYDSAPCGGPGCPEWFEATPCPLARVRMSHAVEFTCRPGT